MQKFPLGSIIQNLIDKINQSDCLNEGITQRFQVEIPEIDFLALFRSVESNPKYYWHSKDNSFASVGIGNVLDSESDLGVFKDFLSDETTRIFAALKFESKDGLLGNFILPEIEFYRNEKYFLVINTISSNLDNVLSKLESILKSPKIVSETRISEYSYSREDYPDYVGWKEMIDTAVAKIKSREIDKIALSRRSVFTFDSSIRIEELFAMLIKENPYTYNYCFVFEDGDALMGVSPEKLYARNEKTISGDSLAGTRKRGKTEAEDKALELDLMNSEKDRKEHNFVRDYLVNILTEISTEINTSDTHVSKFSNVQHLHTNVSAKLNSVDDFKILELLHPTPAVGGSPRDNSLVLIKILEKMERDYYAAPIGFFNKIRSEFAVGIRSAYICGSRIIINSGAGIVSDSQAQDEWDEIENKLDFFLRIFK
jgi:menaquinone-specific isochorismate synthase